MKTRPLLFLFCTLLMVFAIIKPAIAEQSQLVLVASVESTAQLFTPAQLRKLFLGLSSGDRDSGIHPLRNLSDERLYHVFLQKVVFMSARNYERHLLVRVINMGGKRPPSYTSHANLVRQLNADPSSVSYMWAKTANSTQGIKVLQKLW